MEIGFSAVFEAASKAKDLLTTYRKGELTESLQATLRTSIELLERANAEARDEIDRLNRKLDQAQTAHQRAQKELDALKEMHKEDIRVVGGVQFNKGTRTGGKWTAFCPSCSLPVIESRINHNNWAMCTDANCRWSIRDVRRFGELVSEIEKAGQTIS